MSIAYAYRAAGSDGRVVRGQVDASSTTEAASILGRRGLTLLAASPVPTTRHHATAPRQALAMAFRSLATLLQAGVPLDRAVQATLAVVDGRVRDALELSRDGLARGESLATSLGKDPGVIPVSVLAMLRAGERAGRLGEALEQVARQLEYEAELVARLRQALAYPILLAVVGVASVSLIVAVVIPRFAALLSDLGQGVPTSTRLLMSTSLIVQRAGVPVLAIALGAGAIIARRVRTGRARTRWHELLLRLPILGPIRRSLAAARALQGLATALGAGMPLIDALAAAGDACADAALEQRLERVRQSVLAGSTLSAALQAQSGVDPLALQFIALGEASGQLGTMAERGGRLIRGAAERQLGKALTLLEPFLILFFGGLIAVVAAALLQAVYSLRPAA